jgi:hypothetical protein
MLRYRKLPGAMVLAWVLAQAGPALAFSAGDTADTGTGGDTPPLSTVDGDGDNFSPAQGDCDDEDPLAYPGNEEVCGDRIDNDCNGLYDDGCDSRVQFGTLRGGGGCTGGTGVGNVSFVFLPLLPLLLVGRRRA